jgi:hypothetical protein
MPKRHLTAAAEIERKRSLFTPNRESCFDETVSGGHNAILVKIAGAKMRGRFAKNLDDGNSRAFDPNHGPSVDQRISQNSD